MIPKSVHLCQLPLLPLQYPGQSTDTSDSQPKPFIFSSCSSSWIVLPFYQCPKLGTPKPSYTHNGTSLSLGDVSQIHPLLSISAWASQVMPGIISSLNNSSHLQTDLSFPIHSSWGYLLSSQNTDLSMLLLQSRAQTPQLGIPRLLSTCFLKLISHETHLPAPQSY